MFWSEKAHEDSVEGTGVEQLRSTAMPLGGGGVIATLLLQIILVAIFTDPNNNQGPSNLWRIFVCVWSAFAWANALFFVFVSMKAYMSLDGDQKDRFRSATFAGFFAGLFLILLGLIMVTGFYAGQYHNPQSFYAFMFIEEWCFVIVSWLSIYTMRPGSVDRFLSKIFPCCPEQEEMFGSSTIARPAESDTRGRE